MGIDISTVECLNKHRVILQCRYASMVLKHIKKMKYGVSCDNLLKDIRITNGLISSANRYDSRDIPLSTATYNKTTKAQLKCVIEKAYSILKRNE